MIASLGGVGFLPRGPATAASAVGALGFFLVKPSMPRRVALTLAATTAGQLVCQELVGPADADPQYIVIDELAGVWLALLPTPSTGPASIAGAVSFRLLDKLKPGPIRLAERHPVFGVMADDLAAGMFAAALLAAAQRAGLIGR